LEVFLSPNDFSVISSICLFSSKYNTHHFTNYFHKFKVVKDVTKIRRAEYIRWFKNNFCISHMIFYKHYKRTKVWNYCVNLYAKIILNKIKKTGTKISIILYTFNYSLVVVFAIPMNIYHYYFIIFYSLILYCVLFWNLLL
jgi:hypothetical protein